MDRNNSVSTSQDLNAVNIMTNATSSFVESVIFGSFFLSFYSLAITSVLVIGLIANVVAICVISKTASLQTTTNIHLIGLCIADCIHLANSPILLSVVIMRNFAFNDFICKSYMLAQGVNWFAGTFLLSSMSVHRYLTVRHPISRQITHKKRCALVTVLLLYMFALILLSPLAIFAMKQERVIVTAKGETVVKGACVINWRPSWSTSNTTRPAGGHWYLSRVFCAYTFLFGFLLPVGVNIVVYSLLIYHLRLKQRTLFSQIPTRRYPVDNTSSAGTVEENASKADVIVLQSPLHYPKPITCSNNRIQRKLSWKVTSLVLIYVVLWAPYWIQQLVITFFPSVSIFSGTRLALMVQLLGFCNSAINPISYTCLSTPFRQNLSRLVKSNCTCGLTFKSLQLDQEQLKNVTRHKQQHSCCANGCPFSCNCFCDY